MDFTFSGTIQNPTMASIDFRLSSSIYLPRLGPRFHALKPNPNRRLPLKGPSFTGISSPAPELAFSRRRWTAISCQSRSDGDSAEAPEAEDFVARVLRENPSQVEPRYLVGDRFYGLKERERSSRLGNAAAPGTEARSVGSAEAPATKDVALSDILREYKGQLYVPEQVFGRSLPEEEQFRASFEALPAISRKDFERAMEAGKIRMLTWDVRSDKRGDFIVELEEIPGDKSLQTRKWAMTLDSSSALELLEVYKGPRCHVERPSTSMVGKVFELPHPVASSLSGRIMVELGVVTVVMVAAACVAGGFLAFTLAFALLAATTIVFSTVTFVLWPIVRPFVKLLFNIVLGVLERAKEDFVDRFFDDGIYSGIVGFWKYAGTAGVITLLPVVFVVVSMALLIRLMASRRSKNFRKWDLWQGIDFSRSKAEARVDGTTGVKFADVAGIDEAVEELQELVRYLKNPELFDQMGIKPPHGVLLEGPPGCGKTLVAKAIAGEAGVPFYQMAGSEFVEVLVGVGSARIRDLFLRAKVHKPSVIFIDEIDALATRREGIFKESTNELYNASTQERETTLNQLLIELDGFDTGKGVIFLGATNRRDLLDPALLRPGRFDRKIKILPPGAKGRHGILKIHARKVKMSESVDLFSYAQNLPGWSGAKLAQLIQEAALIAVRKGHKSILSADMDDAVDRLTVGPKCIGVELGHQGQCRRATTEVGVAITSHLLRRYENAKVEICDRISIVPHGQTLSQLVFHRLDDEFNIFERRPQLLHRLQVFLGGRAAEEVIYGRDTSKASVNYLADASWLARKILTIWNLENPMRLHGEPPPWRKNIKFVGPKLDFEGSLYDDYDLVEPPLNFNLDDDICERAEELIQDMYVRTVSLLKRNHAALLKTVKVLLNRKEISGDEIEFILDKYPPQMPIDILFEEEDPASLPFVREDETREIEYALVSNRLEEETV